VGPVPVSKMLFNLKPESFALNTAGLYPFYMFLPYHKDEPAPQNLTYSLWPKVVQYNSYCLNFWGTTFASYDKNGVRPPPTPPRKRIPKYKM